MSPYGSCELSFNRPTARCEGDQLLAWAFSPDGPNYKDNVAGYNKAFWEPADKDIPEYGWGATGTIGTQVYKHIQPNIFAPGILVSNGNPSILTTLNTDKDKSPNLGQLEQRKWSFELTGFVFRHFDVGGWLPEGITVRQGATLARRWEIESDFADKTFCKVTNSPATECAKFNIAAPVSYMSFEPSLNVRTKIGTGQISDWANSYIPIIGFSPSISYSTQTSRSRMALPVFLSVDKDGTFNGGFQYAREWGNTDTKKNVGVWSIFISTNFTMDGSKY
ncbi:MAG: hypothetical protein ACOVQ0_11365 [Novosphingobium sp.]|uniref:hypothetical protein n=1 Tax=Novosphingobium sp. TaxID=1874826 RepID=UPI003B9CF10A